MKQIVNFKRRNPLISLKSQNRGVWAVMLTPFTPDKQIDWECLDQLIDWYIESGVSGLFTVCQSGEMYTLTNEERLNLAYRVVKYSNERVPVVASGAFSNTLEKQAAFIKKMADTGVRAVVCLVNQIARQDESDEYWKLNMEKLLDKTGNIYLGLYECPTPYHRTLSADIVGWAASTGRFIFMKQTSSHLNIIEKKIEAVRNTPMLLLNADAATVLKSLRMGISGYSSIAANFYPALWVWLCKHFKNQPEKADQMQRLMSIAEGVVRHKYPTSAKLFLSMSGMKIGTTCRMCNYKLQDDEISLLQALQEEVLLWYKGLGLGETIC